MKKVFAYVHTHWDREWYKEAETFRVRLIEIFDDILNQLEKGELPSFYFDGQTAAIEDYLEIKPENIEPIKKLIREKKLYVGPYYCSTDSFLTDSESLIRNLQFGLKKSKELGCEDFIAYHADTFGHSAQLPEIVKFFDIDYGIFWRGCGENPSEFVYNGLKSTYLIQGYFQDFFSLNVPIEKKAEYLQKTLDKISAYSSENLLLPLGADHLAVPKNLETQINEVNKLLNGYEIILTTPFKYFKNVEFKKVVHSELRDNCRNFILPGVFSSRNDIKALNSKLQFKLSKITEPLQAIFSYLGKTSSYQKEIDYAYKTLVKNHAHDSIYGCSVDSVHKENLIRYEKVSQILKSVKNSVLRDISCGEKLFAINLSDYEFDGFVKIKTDKKIKGQLISKEKGFPFKKIWAVGEIPVTEDYTDIYEYLVPVRKMQPHSIAELHDFNVESDLQISNNSIETSKIKIDIDVKNSQINITDKSSGNVYKDFINIIDRADIGDSYNFGALKGDKKIYAKAKTSKILENGPYRSSLKVIFEIDIPKNSSYKGRSKRKLKHKIEMIIRLENGSSIPKIEMKWTNKSKNHILQAEFKNPSPIEITVSDDLVGLIKRKFDPDYDIYEKLPAPRGIELKYNTSAMQNFVSTNEFCVFAPEIYEYEIHKNNLMLTLLRATGTISNPSNPTRGTPAGPPLPTPDLQQLGENYAAFALSFDCDEDKCFEISEILREPIVPFFSELADITPQDIFEINNRNIKISAVKLDSDSNLVLRLKNRSSEEQKLDFKTKLPYKNIFIADALENPIKPYYPTTIEPLGFVNLILKK